MCSYITNASPHSRSKYYAVQEAATNKDIMFYFYFFSSLSLIDKYNEFCSTLTFSVLQSRHRSRDHQEIPGNRTSQKKNFQLAGCQSKISRLFSWLSQRQTDRQTDRDKDKDRETHTRRGVKSARIIIPLTKKNFQVLCLLLEFLEFEKQLQIL